MAETAIARKRTATTTHTACDPLKNEPWSAKPLSCWPGTTEVTFVSIQATLYVGVTVTVMMKGGGRRIIHIIPNSLIATFEYEVSLHTINQKISFCKLPKCVKMQYYSSTMYM